jgi:hypothetical protein
VRRSVLALVLTGLVVLVAGGAAAALNARVLDASAASPVGGLASYLPSTSPSGSSSPAPSGAFGTAGPLPVPTTSITPDSVEDTTGASAARGTTATDPSRSTAASRGARPTAGRTSGTNGTHAATARRTSTRSPLPTRSSEPGDDRTSGSGSDSGGGGHSSSPSPSPSHSSDD